MYLKKVVVVSVTVEVQSKLVKELNLRFKWAFEQVVVAKQQPFLENVHRKVE
jgi:hypothetical protein